MYKLFFALFCFIAIANAQPAQEKLIKQKVHQALAPLSRLSAKLREASPNATECFDDFLASAINHVAEDAFEAIACVENRIDDFYVELNALGEKVNKTLEGAVPELEEFVNNIVGMVIMKDWPGVFAEARRLVGFLIETAGDLLVDVGSFVNVVVQMIEEEEAKACLLEAFVAGVTHVNVALEELEICIKAAELAPQLF